jgi:tetraacyldisaccharide 4'-kinase
MLAGDGVCPVAIGARRAAAARLLAEQGCNLVLSDDGLQHLAMCRVLDIVVVDGARGFGNGALLPAGPLREPAQGLQRADLVVMHGDDALGVAVGIETLAMHLVPGCLREVATGRAMPLESLPVKAVHAVAGTGNPQRFFSLLRGQGLQPVEHVFADHHAFRASDLAFGDDLPIVMTEKDAVKCRAFAARNMYWLPVAATFAAPDAARLLQRIIAVTTERGGKRA